MHARPHPVLGHLSRRSLLGTALASGIATLAWPARAQVKGVEIIAPAGPGGGYDQLARATQQVLQSEGLASGVQVANIPGAGGTIGLAQFVSGKKRGNNLLAIGLGMIGAIKINKAPVTLDQVTPLARLTGEYQPLVVGADSPIKSLDDLVQKFKADPGSVSWGGFALGSPDHLLCAMTVKATGGDVTKMNYIVAGAGGEMLSSVMGGHITVATGGLNEFAQQMQAGKLRALAISSPERLPGVDIPSFKEQGVDVELVNWRGLMAPQGIREKDKKALDEALGKMVQSEPWQALVKERGWVDMYQPSEQFAAFLEGEQARIGELLKDLGLA
jgi:putative tricarboxylic transport membrane protein